tara:strand:+ start:855 stop:1295 length:441 start_codon:yes stop_codon:yes gene_type:complete
MKKIGMKLNSLNKYLSTNKFFAGFMFLILNVGAKYATVNITKSQQEYIKKALFREILIFAIIFVGTRDLFVSLILTVVFMVFTDYLFNDSSKFCVIPKHLRKFEDLIDTDGDGKISEEEIQNAMKILERAKKKEAKRDKLRKGGTL